MSLLTYTQRASLHTNPTAQKLLQLIETKKSNLAVSADLLDKASLLALVRQIGPHICVLKTHIDIVENFDFRFITELKQLAHDQQFLIFEDRKFADIGNTVRLQYAAGLYQIAEWATITNAHPLPGPGIIEGLQSVGLSKGNALLLLAEMSSQGNLITADYTTAVVEMAKAYPEFVIGFIAQHRLTPDPFFIHFMPGIHLSQEGDPLGQQYTTPEEAILRRGCDVMIVGRGIYAAANPQAAAKEYQEAGWAAYQQLL